jgi:TatD DNase family protein
MGGTFLKVFVILRLMELVDVHNHLELLNDLDHAIIRAKESGVKKIITSGIDHETNRKALELKKEYEIVECSLGIYPKDALKKEYEASGKAFKECDVEEEIAFIKKHQKDIMGIGEVGLDFSSENINQKEQEKLFVKMIKLAKELNKPLIVHSRKAEKEVLEILERENAKKVVMHCFCGNKNLVKEGALRGYYFTIPTNVNRASNFQSMVKEVNINQLLTETDGPFLSPIKGEPNEPANITVTIKEIAKIKGFDEKETANNIFLNYMRLFK